MERVRIASVMGCCVFVLGAGLLAQDAALTRARALDTLQRACAFFHGKVACHGGYVWDCTSDLSRRWGEGKADADTVWVQPPGTPEVGLVFMEAYRTTGDRAYLDAAKDAAYALVKGQLLSGGWGYSISFAPDKRSLHAYRVDASAHQRGPSRSPAPDGEGWHAWRRRKFPRNRTMMDDNTTQCAIRLLVRVDKALDFADSDIHEAAEYALKSIMNAQYPIGAWSHNYDRFCATPPDPERYPVLRASFPESWSKRWTKDFTGCYMINDHITPDAVVALLDAYSAYGDERYLAAAERGGEFLLLAQMPDPQPAWAQQYNSRMHPVWDRGFEPPAISGWESQGVLETLLLLYRHTGKRRFLDAVPEAIAYLRESLLPDGRLARFYELRTNRPLYFTKQYQITYDSKSMPKHYGFAFDSRLDAIEAEYERLAALPPAKLADQPAAELTDELRKQVAEIIGAIDERGAWVQVAGKRKTAVIKSRTFIDNIRALCRYIWATDAQ